MEKNNMSDITVTLKNGETERGELNTFSEEGGLSLFISRSENLNIPQDFGLYSFAFAFKDILRIEGHDQVGIQEARDLNRMRRRINKA